MPIRSMDIERSPRLADCVRRYWSRVAPEGECWNWTGSVGTHGYGMEHWYGKTVTAHRLSWEMHFGPIPFPLYVLHTCDNHRCVRPEHLWIGSHQDNMADMVAKGRNFVPHATACKNGHAYTEGSYKMRGTSRQCRACERARHLRHESKKRAVAR